MAVAFRVNLEMTHLMAGVEEPILEQTEHPINYLPESWVMTIWRRLKLLRSKLWIENIWRPKKQRVNYHRIMAALSKIPGVRKTQLETANLCRV